MKSANQQLSASILLREKHYGRQPSQVRSSPHLGRRNHRHHHRRRRDLLLHSAAHPDTPTSFHSNRPQRFRRRQRHPKTRRRRHRYRRPRQQARLPAHRQRRPLRLHHGQHNTARPEH